MITCERCGVENLLEESQLCKGCGAPLISATEPLIMTDVSEWGDQSTESSPLYSTGSEPLSPTGQMDQGHTPATDPLHRSSLRPERKNRQQNLQTPELEVEEPIQTLQSVVNPASDPIKSQDQDLLTTRPQSEQIDNATEKIVISDLASVKTPVLTDQSESFHSTAPTGSGQVLTRSVIRDSEPAFGGESSPSGACEHRPATPQESKSSPEETLEPWQLALFQSHSTHPPEESSQRLEQATSPGQSRSESSYTPDSHAISGKAGLERSRKEQLTESNLYKMSHFSVPEDTLTVPADSVRTRHQEAKPPVENHTAPPEKESSPIRQREALHSEVSPPHPTPTGRGKPADLNRTTTGGKGIAYLSTSRGGSQVHFRGGVKLHEGDEIIVVSLANSPEPPVPNRIYQLQKPKSPHPPRSIKLYALYGLGGLICLLVFLISFNSFFRAAKPEGHIAGVVFDQNTRQLLPDVTVRIKENGKAVNTDEFGFFNFALLPPGEYNLEAKTNPPQAKQSSRQKVFLAKNSTRTVKIGLVTTDDAPAVLSSPKTDLAYSSISSPSASSANRESQPKPVPGAVEKTMPTPATAGKGYGTLKVSANTPNATVLLDGKPIGIGNTTYRNIASGSHRVSITKSGFQTWETTVQITANKISYLKPVLEPEPLSSNSRLTAEEYLESARQKFATHDYSGAIADYDQALIMRGDYPIAISGRGSAWLQMGQNQKAYADFRQAGLMFFNSGKYDQAAENLSQALQIVPSDIDLLQKRAQSYFKAGRYRESQQDYLSMTQSSPNSADAFFGLGQVEYQFGNLKAAIRAFEKAADLSPTTPDYYAFLAMAHFETGNKNKARKYFGRFNDFANYLQKEAMTKYPTWEQLLKNFGPKE